MTSTRLNLIILFIIILMAFPSHTNRIILANRSMRQMMISTEREEINTGHNQITKNQITSPRINSISTYSVPILSSPDDITYREGDTGYSIDWTIDGSGANKIYSIFQNKSEIVSGNWSPNSIISINIDGLTAGSYNYTIVASTTDGATSDQVWVYVTSPFSFTSTPNDLIYSINSTGNKLSWTATATNPYIFSVYRNNSLLVQGGWQSDVPIIISVDFLEVGVYNYTISISNSTGHIRTDQVYVSVVSGPVIKDSTPQVLITQLNVNTTIHWTPEAANPNYYEIYNETDLLITANWTSGIPINYTISPEHFGNYTFKIVVYDLNNDFGTENKTVIVNPPPEIRKSPNSMIEVEEDTSILLEWQANDTEPDTYSLVLDEINFRRDSWNNQSTVQFDCSILSLGLHNISVTYYDQFQLSTMSTIRVNITDSISPQILSAPVQSNFSYQVDNISLTWQMNETNPFEVQVVYNNSNTKIYHWFESNFTLNFVNRSLGNHNLKLTFRDKSDNIISTKLTMIIYDDVSPVLQSGPSNHEIEYGKTIQTFVWQIDDYSSGTFELYRNNTKINTGGWSTSQPIIYQPGDLTIGSYNFTLNLLDDYNNSLNLYHIVRITPRSTIKPQINIPDTVYEGQNFEFDGIWQIKNSSKGVSNADITGSLILNSAILRSVSTRTNQNGSYTLVLDHNKLKEGNYTWQLDYIRENYQDWHIVLHFSIHWRVIQLRVLADKIMNQGNNFTVQVQTSYDTKLTVYQNQQFPRVNLTLSLSVIWMNKSRQEITMEQTSKNGIATFNVPPKLTKYIRKVTSLQVQLSADQYAYQGTITYDTKNLPEVHARTVFYYFQIVLNLTSRQIYLIFVSLSVPLIVLISIRLSKLLKILKEYQRIGWVEQLSNIYSVLIFNNSGIPYYEKKFINANLLDSSLFAGLSTAITHFLDEVSLNKKQGYKEIKNQGLSITIISNQDSHMAIISEESLDQQMRMKFEAALNKIIEQMQNTRSGEIGYLIPQDEVMIEKTLTQHNIPLTIMNNLHFDFVRMEVELRQNNINHFYLKIVENLKKFYRQHDPSQNITLRELYLYLKNEGIRREFIGPFIYDLHTKSIIF